MKLSSGCVRAECWYRRWMELEGIVLKLYLVNGKNTDHPLRETIAIDFDNLIDNICTCILQCFANI
jgi:hypothetical protein